MGGPCRMRGEEMPLDHDAAIGNAVEERLCPVPSCVEANGPPQRAGAPETEAEDEADESCRKQTEGRLAGVRNVTKSKDEGEDGGGGPETQDVGS